jgi:SAM-dependent methyltransferase
MEMILSVGCGKRPAESNVIRLDISADVEPDVVWDLNQFPYPFENSLFTIIECLDVIEHVADIPKVMEEFHRILKPNGLLKITTPHFSSANSYIDPTHKWHLSCFSFDYFCEGHELSYYSKAKYRRKTGYLQFQGGRFSRTIIARLANKFPQIYEQRFAWIFPAWFLYFELEAVK